VEAEFIFRLTLLALRILLQTYGSEYNVNEPYVFFLEGERLVITGEFKDAEKIVLCDDEFIYNCSYKNEQQILIKGQTQILLVISTYPWRQGDRVWYHVIPTKKKGHRFIIGNIYDQATPITKGGY